MRKLAIMSYGAEYPLMTEGGWTLEVFEADNGHQPFTSFIEDLDETAFAALDEALKHVLAVRGMDLVRTEWLKPLGEGLHEFRVRHTADEIAHMFNDEPPGTGPKPPESILLRVFVHFYGQRVVLLLSGYDKQDDASRRRQEQEIQDARKCLTAWRQQEARRKAQKRRAAPLARSRGRRGR